MTIKTTPTNTRHTSVRLPGSDHVLLACLRRANQYSSLIANSRLSDEVRQGATSNRENELIIIRNRAAGYGYFVSEEELAEWLRTAGTH